MQLAEGAAVMATGADRHSTRRVISDPPTSWRRSNWSLSANGTRTCMRN